jgi:hypothetical protein
MIEFECSLSLYFPGDALIINGTASKACTKPTDPHEKMM